MFELDLKLDLNIPQKIAVRKCNRREGKNSRRKSKNFPGSYCGEVCMFSWHYL